MRIVLLTAAFLLTLFLPWPGSLAPALALCILAPVQCARSIRAEWENADWRYAPKDADLLRMQGVCLDPWLFIGDRRMTAEVRLPFEAVAAERFRSRPGAMALSAAIALTDDCAVQQKAAAFSTREEMICWERAMGIVSDNFKTRNPKLDDARYRGFQGVVVRDGEEERAYFVGDVGIHQLCTLILDGTARVMTPADREQLHATVPSRALCYVTGRVEEGRLSEMCYLGSVLPRQNSLPSREAMESGMTLNDQGLGIMLNSNAGLTLQLVENMGIEWPEDDGNPRYIELIPRHGEEDQPRDFAAAVDSLRAYALRERNKQLMAGMLGLLLWPCATLCASQWTLLLGLGCLCAGILFCWNIPCPPDNGTSVKPYWMPLIPGIQLPLVMALFLPGLQGAETASTVGAFLLMAMAGVTSLLIPWLVRDARAASRFRTHEMPMRWMETAEAAFVRFASRGIRAVAQTAVCWAVAFLALWLVTQANLLAVLFGLLAGLLTGVAVCLTHDWARKR